MKTDLRRRLSESVEAAAGLAAGLVEVEIVDERGRAAALLRAVRLPQLRHLDPRAGAADLLLQLAPRRLRALPRARLPAGDRPRAGRPRPDPLAGRGRAAALEPRHHRLLAAADRRRRRGVRRRRRQALVEAEESRERDLPLRHRRASATRSPTPTASAAAAPTRSASRGSSTTSSAATRRPTRRPTASGSRATWPSSPARSARAPACGRRASRSRSAASASPSTATSRRGRRRSGSTTLEMTETERAIARLIVREITERLAFLENVGIGYLSLARSARSLSGGEAQRIRLATQIGSQPGRRHVRARRALDRPPPARQREADRAPSTASATSATR